MRNFINKLLIILFFSSTAFSLHASYKSDAMLKAQTLKLSTDPYWAKLLHYVDGKSIINNESFFLSKDGKTDLEQELQATIINFQNNPELTCKYPARYKWLNSQLNLSTKQHHSCSKLDEFLKPNFSKISIAFTSERYNSSASVFGHTFIKLESSEIPYVIDYTADVESNVTAISYAYKGIFGKYKSKYRFFPFSLKDYEYRNEEFRDLITFELNYTKDEIENILLHLYEVLQTDQDYYFLTRNCSSELIKLVDFANYGSDLSSELGFVTVPIEIVYILKKNNHIDNIGVTESKLKLFNSAMEGMSDSELEMLNMIIERKISVYMFDEDSSIPSDAKARIILAAIAYIEIKSQKEDFDTGLMYPLMKLIDIKGKNGIDSSFDKTSYIESIPISDKFHKAAIGYDYQREDRRYLNLGYRYLYRNRFDLLDDVEKHGSVELFDLSMRAADSEMELNYLTLINLEAVPVSTGYFNETTRKIKLEISREFYSDLLYWHIDYGLGYRYRINKNLTYNFHAKTGVYYNKEDIYLASGEFSLEYNVISKFTCEVKYESNYFANFRNRSSSIKSNNLYLNSYLRVSKGTAVNLLLSHKEDIQSYNGVNFLYNIYF